MNLLFIVLDANMDLGITISIVGFGIVFLALALLAYLFIKMPVVINLAVKKKTPKKQEKAIQKVEENIEGNVTAAISLALHLYLNDMHDEESNVVTIKQVRRTYSPWSSKIYSVTNNWPRG